MPMKRSVLLLVLAAALAANCGGCFMIAWKGTEAVAGTIRNNEKPDQGPVLRGVEEGAGATHNAMKRVDAAEDAAIQKVKNAVTK
jgi:hypothetical protein